MDQISKHFFRWYVIENSEINLLNNHLIICFIENDGMAFGLKLPFNNQKIILLIIRIVIIISIMINIILYNYNKEVIYGFLFIISGGISNIIDVVFNGIIYNYAPIMKGNVTDIIYFPFIENICVLNTVFNIADIFIFIGVIIVFIYFKY